MNQKGSYVEDEVTRLNPLVIQAASDRHTECCVNQHCQVCGSHVSTYNANESLSAARPEAWMQWDWWVSCDNADCIHAWGEGLFQTPPSWVDGGDH